MEILEILFQTIIILILLIGAIVGIKQINLLRKQIIDQDKWNRRVTSMNYCFTDDPNIWTIRDKLNKHLKIHSRVIGEISFDEIQNLSNGQYQDIYADLDFILGRLEAMCVGLHNSVLDEDICKDMVGGIVEFYYRLFSQYIDVVRTKKQNEKIYEWLEHYAKKWGNDKP